MNRTKPEILAPAGDRAAFLSAVAAGADAIYCGLKHFSARMAAVNFSMEELADLTRLAHENKIAVYVALNTLVKPDELDTAGRFIDRLNRHVSPDALIIQDPGVISLAAQAGFSGDLHLSTLANVSFPAAMKLIRFFPQVKRVVLPRELSIDEIKAVADACPADLELEIFVHGALCYAVSGRCYWSSYFGGKSGLRGRCVQPCRRVYDQGEKQSRFFSCQDLWLDVLTKLLLSVPRLSALKIEGRKKGPHYVYYTVKAYQLFRDHPGDTESKKAAAEYLDYALGRPGTHYNFLPQRPWNPIDTDTQTGSGLLIGKISGAKPSLVPREPLFPGDLLRIGYEDESWHRTWRVGKYVPKKGRLYLKMDPKNRPANQTPVFLIDRREPELEKEIRARENTLQQQPAPLPASNFHAKLPKKGRGRGAALDMQLRRTWRRTPGFKGEIALWLDPDTDSESAAGSPRVWYWLPPVIWPGNEAAYRRAIDAAVDRGCRKFVINAPWQAIFFPPAKKARIWAGPFCNAANGLAIENLARLGVEGVIVSPELGKNDYALLSEQSPVPLGIVIYGNWPLCVSRTASSDIAADRFFVSPKGEQAWVHRYGSDYWVFPEWTVDLTGRKPELTKMGYRLFVEMIEPVPKGIEMKKRPGLWNWEIGLA